MYFTFVIILRYFAVLLCSFVIFIFSLLFSQIYSVFYAKLKLFCAFVIFFFVAFFFVFAMLSFFVLHRSRMFK